MPIAMAYQKVHPSSQQHSADDESGGDDWWYNDQQYIDYGTGRLCDVSVPSEERNYALAIHLVPLLAFFIVLGPLAFIPALVMWLIRKDDAAFIDDHGREHMNLWLTGVVLSICLIMIPIIGWLALVGWYISAAINMVRACVAASNGQYFRYPMVFRFLS